MFGPVLLVLFVGLNCERCRSRDWHKWYPQTPAALFLFQPYSYSHCRSSLDDTSLSPANSSSTHSACTSAGVFRLLSQQRQHNSNQPSVSTGKSTCQVRHAYFVLL